MKYIEILGAAGSGKSTFLNLLEDKKHLNLWTKLEDALVEAASDRLSSENNISNKFLELYLNQNFTSIFKSRLANYILQRSKNCFGKYNDFEALLEVEINTTRHNETPLRKADRIRNYLNIIENLYILKDLKYKKTVLLDEGLIRHHSCLEKVDGKKITWPVAVINCYINEEDHLNRIRKRVFQGGKLVPSHRNLTDDELLSHIIKVNEQNNKKLQILRSNMVPVVDVDLGVAVSDLPVKTTLSFIKTSIKETLIEIN